MGGPMAHIYIYATHSHGWAHDSYIYKCHSQPWVGPWLIYIYICAAHSCAPPLHVHTCLHTGPLSFHYHCIFLLAPTYLLHFSFLNFGLIFHKTSFTSSSHAGAQGTRVYMQPIAMGGPMAHIYMPLLAMDGPMAHIYICLSWPWVGPWLIYIYICLS